MLIFAMLILADADPWRMLTLGVSIFNGIGLMWVAGKTRKIEKLEENVALKSEQFITQQIAAKFAPLEVGMNNLAQKLQAFSDQVERRLQDGDQDFGSLNDKREFMAINIEARFGELKAWIAQNYLNRDDLRRHSEGAEARTQRMEEAVQTMKTAVAVIQAAKGARS